MAAVFGKFWFWKILFPWPEELELWKHDYTNVEPFSRFRDKNIDLWTLSKKSKYWYWIACFQKSLHAVCNPYILKKCHLWARVLRYRKGQGFFWKIRTWKSKRIKLLLDDIDSTRQTGYWLEKNPLAHQDPKLQEETKKNFSKGVWVTSKKG